MKNLKNSASFFSGLANHGQKFPLPLSGPLRMHWLCTAPSAHHREMACRPSLPHRRDARPCAPCHSWCPNMKGKKQAPSTKHKSPLFCKRPRYEIEKVLARAPFKAAAPGGGGGWFVFLEVPKGIFGEIMRANMEKKDHQQTIIAILNRRLGVPSLSRKSLKAKRPQLSPWHAMAPPQRDVSTKQATTWINCAKAKFGPIFWGERGGGMGLGRGGVVVWDPGIAPPLGLLSC